MTCVRPAVLADAVGISRVQVSSWLQAYAGLMPESYLKQQSVEGRLARWSELLGSKNDAEGGTWVATRHDDIVGFVSFGPCRDPQPSRGLNWEVYALYVTPDQWGQGVGASLIAEALSRLPAAAEVVSLWVLAGNQRAIRFYEKCGFAHDGTEKVEMRGGYAIREQRFVRPLGGHRPGETRSSDR